MNILVCVTKQNTMKHLLQKGLTLKEETSGELFVVHVTKKELIHLSNEIQFFYDICKSYNASFGVIHSDRIVKAIARYVKENQIDKIVLGETRQENPRQSTMFRLEQALNGFTELIIVPVLEQNEFNDII